jgi:hypothetical protein
MEGQRGSLSAERQRLGNSPDATRARLEDATRLTQETNIIGSGAIQTGWFRTIQVQLAIVDAPGGEGSEKMLHHRHTMAEAA